MERSTGTVSDDRTEIIRLFRSSRSDLSVTAMSPLCAVYSLVLNIMSNMVVEPGMSSTNLIEERAAGSYKPSGILNKRRLGAT